MDTELRRAQLRRMRTIATGALVVLAVIFVVMFLLQERHPWAAYVRAGAEGGMVGALADWFAVTALFRRPLGLPIPHTALIPRKKDQLGVSLGAFVEENFLSDEVLSGKLEQLHVTHRVGTWLQDPDHAERVATQGAAVIRGALEVVSDEDVQRVAEDLVRRHVVEPEWSSTLGLLLGSVVEHGHHHGAVDVLAARALDWAVEHPDTIVELVEERSPSWLPRTVDRLIGERLHKELVGFLRGVVNDPQHAARRSIDEWLTSLAEGMQHDPATIATVERFKRSLIEDPRLRQVALDTWARLKESLSEVAENPDSALRVSFVQGIRDLGARVSQDPVLTEKIDGWIRDAALHVAQGYRHQAAGLITDTIASWDAAEASDRIEVLVGRDLQFIRLNGTVVGALAGTAIFTVAQLLLG
jgi:uncharacterized membrane-anchored protein YjiN (DUF445 family)